MFRQSLKKMWDLKYEKNNLSLFRSGQKSVFPDPLQEHVAIPPPLPHPITNGVSFSMFYITSFQAKKHHIDFRCSYSEKATLGTNTLWSLYKGGLYIQVQ